MLLDQILAQEGPVRALRRALRRGRLAQAYLFEGPSGVGKRKTALALATTAICPQEPPGCGKCQVCSRVTSMTHPDVRVYEPRPEGDRNIQVQFVRDEILPFTKFAPFEAPAAFVIFPQADLSFPAQHAQAANALLKTLEEPRPHITFLLLAERPDRLLPTIRSRCQRIRFGRLPAAVVEQILKRYSVPEPVAHNAAALANGRADRALELARGQKAERLVELALRIDAVVEEAKPAPLLDLAAELARDEDLFLIMETLVMFYRDNAAATLDCAERELVLDDQQYSAIGPPHTRLDARRAAERVDLIHRTCDDLERNANTEIALDAMLFALGSV